MLSCPYNSLNHWPNIRMTKSTHNQSYLGWNWKCSFSSTRKACANFPWPTTCFPKNASYRTFCTNSSRKHSNNLGLSICRNLPFSGEKTCNHHDFLSYGQANLHTINFMNIDSNTFQTGLSCDPGMQATTSKWTL
mmetsp:Transcript_2289/g.5027  ORF Transcript_2289/g.5027 Transcript_2289/m.5027 type:complete len:135 (-) Transcript_2289:207-611(-)